MTRPRPAPEATGRDEGVRTGLRALLRFALKVILALSVAAGLRSCVAATFRVPSDSMAETLLAGDHVWVDRIGPRVGGLRRGDVVVFARAGAWHVKRVAARGGERVAWQGGALRVDGVPVGLPPDALGAWSVDCGAGPGAARERRFVARAAAARRLAGACTLTPDARAVRDTALVVSAGHLYVVGDHRTASQDSRDYGAIEASSVVGRVVGVYLSLDPSTGALRRDRMRWLR